MDIYLPVADMMIFAPYILGIAIFVGFISGLLGIGGGFIVTPMMISLGIPPIMAIGASSAQVFSSSAYAVSHYQKKKIIPLKASVFFVTGGIMGVMVGVKTLGFLSTYYNLDMIIHWAFIVLLCCVMGVLFMPPPSDDKHRCPKVFVKKQLLELLIFGIMIGFISGMLGISGNVLIVPALIYFLYLNRQNAVVMSQFNALCVSLIGFITNFFVNHNIDPVLCILLVIGGFLGSYIGVKFSHKLSATTSRHIFISVILLTLCILFYDLLK